jgi:hypothetical protein
MSTWRCGWICPRSYFFTAVFWPPHLLRSCWWGHSWRAYPKVIPRRRARSGPARSPRCPGPSPTRRATSGHRRRGGPRTGGRSRGPLPPSLSRRSWRVRCGGSPPSAHRALDCLRRTTPTGAGGHRRTRGRVAIFLPNSSGDGRSSGMSVMGSYPGSPNGN